MALTSRKYFNQPTEADGYTFDSKAEATRYTELKLMVRAGIISDLIVHPQWTLPVNGMVVGRYAADFCYSDTETGKLVIEDVKGVRTPVYKLKAKLMLAIHGLTIVEIPA